MATPNGRDDTERLPERVTNRWDRLSGWLEHRWTRATGWTGDRWSRFNDWRAQRPFLGGVLLCLAGLFITWVPMQILPDLLFVGGRMTGFLAIGTLFGVFVFLSGVYALYRPEHSTEIGVVGVVLSIFSLFGSLGGLFLGMLFGILGGNLCIAWIPADDADDAVSEPGTVDAALVRFREGISRVAEKTGTRLRDGVETITQRDLDD
ncbi:DUF6114 domain-containing protein [Natrinema salaciae]|uniref:Uncharacterized protein n=1 Tax=Natrinema salaciae TaxID=1186196 RepID=A0A1H9LD41_9EURY|nr:DUF6114 domain-containing protein [Natrinema salaciae]SER09258.1 hypothetical protein SAMN04489841_2927 [Natrinema salaciae]